MLNEALLSLSPDSEDGHIRDLTSRTKSLELEAKGDGGEVEQTIGPELHKVGSREQEAEIDKES